MADFNNISTVSTANTAGDSVFNAVEFRSVSPTQVSTALSGRQQVKTLGTQYFEFKATFVPMTHTDFKPIYAFLAGQQGQFGTFTINLPVTHSGTLTTGTATGTAGSTSLTVSGTGTLKAGDFIGFNDSSHSKAYMVTADASISGSGAVTITPALQQSPSSDTFYTGGSVDFKVRLKTDVHTYISGPTGFYNQEIDLVEAI